MPVRLQRSMEKRRSEAPNSFLHGFAQFGRPRRMCAPEMHWPKTQRSAKKVGMDFPDLTLQTSARRPTISGTKAKRSAKIIFAWLHPITTLQTPVRHLTRSGTKTERSAKNSELSRPFRRLFLRLDGTNCSSKGKAPKKMTHLRENKVQRRLGDRQERCQTLGADGKRRMHRREQPDACARTHTYDRKKIAT